MSTNIMIDSFEAKVSIARELQPTSCPQKPQHQTNPTTQQTRKERSEAGGNEVGGEFLANSNRQIREFRFAWHLCLFHADKRREVNVTHQNKHHAEGAQDHESQVCVLSSCSHFIT